MSQDNAAVDDRQPRLIEIPEQPAKPLRVIAPSNPVWTENKAQFIMRYLRYFVYITKHGTYIDGFAGPQAERETESWAAKLVLESEPKRIRHFHLCDANPSQVVRLEKLKASQPSHDSSGKLVNRDITVYSGDFNQEVDRILNAGTISEKEATFCLLDQRTFECEWTTVERIARYKKSGMKIELFYFLANSWLNRALSAQKDLEKLARWWGRDDWPRLREMSRDTRRDAMVVRMKDELGYKYVMPWQIFKRKTGGIIMYYMIHATDHPDAPGQMSRAYRNTVLPLEPIEQLDLVFADEPKGPALQQPPAADGIRTA
jgi:three-Cys-motif partner protein